MGMRRIAELVAMLMIGEGVLTIIAPRRHSLLWEYGPEGYKRAIEAFARTPHSDQARGCSRGRVGSLASLESVFAGGGRGGVSALVGAPGTG